MVAARTVFLGSGGFAVPILEALEGAPEVELVGVVTTPPRPVGREGYLTSTPVEHRARQLGLHVLAPERLRDPICRVAIEALEPDLLVLSDYGRIVPQELLDVPPKGALNLHPSLLPRYRGAVPIPAAIMAGDAVTGVTLMRMDAGLDTGPIVAQVEEPLAGDEDTPTLEARLSAVAAELLLASLSGWLRGELVAVPQPDDGVILTRPFRRADGRLDPTRSAAELERQVRALRPWPGTFLEVPGGRLIVHDARVADAGAHTGAMPGTVAVTGAHGMRLLTADGALDLLEVQFPGKRRMTAAEAVSGLRGNPPAWLATRIPDA